MKFLLFLPLFFGVFPDSFVQTDSFSVTFTQVTQNPLFPEIRDEGTLQVKGCKFRFAYTTNEKRITIGNCREVYQYLEGQSEPLVYQWEELSQNPFLQLLINRDVIHTAFVREKISDDPVVYRLVPKETGKDTPFMVLKITLNANETRPEAIEVIDETQQVTTYTFRDFQVDADLPESLFVREDTP